MSRSLLLPRKNRRIISHEIGDGQGDGKGTKEETATSLGLFGCSRAHLKGYAPIEEIRCEIHWSHRQSCDKRLAAWIKAHLRRSMQSNGHLKEAR